MLLLKSKSKTLLDTKKIMKLKMIFVKVDNNFYKIVKKKYEKLMNR